MGRSLGGGGGGGGGGLTRFIFQDHSACTGWVDSECHEIIAIIISILISFYFKYVRVTVNY